MGLQTRADLMVIYSPDTRNANSSGVLKSSSLMSKLDQHESHLYKICLGAQQDWKVGTLPCANLLPVLIIQPLWVLILPQHICTSQRQHSSRKERNRSYSKNRQSLVFPTNIGSLEGIVKCAVGEAGSTPGEVLENTERLFQPRLAPSAHEQRSNATVH